MDKVIDDILVDWNVIREIVVFRIMELIFEQVANLILSNSECISLVLERDILPSAASVSASLY